MQPELCYVYDGIEVVLTGRRAVKPQTNSMSRLKQASEIALVEIEPKNSDSDGSWKRWVSFSDLYTIVEEE